MTSFHSFVRRNFPNARPKSRILRRVRTGKFLWVITTCFGCVIVKFHALSISALERAMRQLHSGQNFIEHL